MHPELKRRLQKLGPLSAKAGSIMIANLETSPDANFFYFTNSSVNGVFYYDFDEPRIFTSEMEYAQAGKSWVRSVEAIKPQQLEKLKGTIGINKKCLSVDIFQRLKKTADISAALEGARTIKSAYEIKQLKAACSITKKLWPKIESEASKKLTEREMKGIIEFLINRRGCEPSFPTIVAGGKNSRYPHHTPTGAKLKEPIVIDFGGRFNGYCSDMTRTIGSEKQEMLEQIIEEAEPLIKPNTKASDIDNFVRKQMGSEAKFFIHGLGHGIGVEVHERPSISRNSTDLLKPGMCFTIEPGIYSKEGIRIENDYLLTKKKLVCLTK